MKQVDSSQVRKSLLESCSLFMKCLGVDLNKTR